MSGYICRRDRSGVVHFAYPPSQAALQFGPVVSTVARCDVTTSTSGTVEDVPQFPTCIWCALGRARP